MDGEIVVLKRPVVYHADAKAYDVRRRKGFLGTEIIGTVHAVDMVQALTAAKKYYPDYWFLTPKSQRRATDRVLQ